MSESEFRLVVFETDIGWVGVMHCDRVIHRVRIGFASMLDAAMAFREHRVGPDEPNGWEKKLIRRIAKGLTHGAAISKSKSAFCFDDIDVDDDELTDFQRKVVTAVRNLGFGETASYGELANRVGHPGAARAVGTVMRKNRFPIIVPCHRVLSSNGIGGFTSARGVGTKRLLLQIEGHEID
ncbi:methylated-DNA--[protein]-cysteine S-methyltransferase [Mariniblastus fucicola]|uniref:Methylated-DNA--protein-cysteine methyltransferase n=1 Tax=Mariniblastus fucicola TaxID=980251 RepID=A0A5B9PI52_9BACT|nr:MGMT family protein [Mariniblastus fucicola]QEG22501.1 Methylated-DNA--protein-cysteine methyltransferase [Mariniblastus fucicola]